MAAAVRPDRVVASPGRAWRRPRGRRSGGRGPRGQFSLGRSERGAGTVLSAGVGIALVVLLISGTLLAQAAVSAHRAATAADLAALAGADAARGLRDGEPCRLAAETAIRQHARLLRCARSGELGFVVEVETAVTVTGFLPDATGRARAGPPP